MWAWLEMGGEWGRGLGEEHMDQWERSGAGGVEESRLALEGRFLSLAALLDQQAWALP